MRICVDPGHGGRDPGARGAGGITEKAVVLAVAKLLAENLEARGHATLLTRDDDTFIPLRQRAETSDGMGADCLVSIHANAASNPAANGAWVIYDDKSRSENGPALAREIFLAMDRIPGIGDADEAEEVYADRTGWVGNRDLTVISASKATAVLVELGFITNPGDMKDLTDPEMQRQLAEAIADGIETWGFSKGLILPEEPEHYLAKAHAGIGFKEMTATDILQAPARKAAAAGETNGHLAQRTIRAVIEDPDVQAGLGSVKTRIVQLVFSWLMDQLETIAKGKL